MQLAGKEAHLKSDEHKQINTMANKFYCDIRDKSLENKVRHFQSEKHKK